MPSSDFQRLRSSARGDRRASIRAIYSGDTIIERAYWGTQALAFTWLRFAGTVKAQVPDCPLYWFLIVKGHRTYRYLSAFSIDFYPHWQMPTPPWAQSIMTGLARRRFNDAYDAERGVVSFPQSRGHLRPVWAEIEPEEAARPDVAFFLRSNPGYVRGDELVCLTELSCRQSASPGTPRIRARRCAPERMGPILAAARVERERVRRALRRSADVAADAAAAEFSRANAETAFGRAHGFGAIGSIEDFRARVPIRSYEEFRPWLDRVADGEPAVLTREPVIAFEETGGSTSGRKLIPYTASSLLAFRAAVLPWLAGLADRRPAAFGGKAYVAISPVARQPRSIGGIRSA